jgi:hypothetical protein
MTIDTTLHIYNIQLTKNVRRWNLFISKFSSAVPIYDDEHQETLRQKEKLYSSQWPP